MRPHVARLDTNAMPWTPGDMTGLFSKILSHDPKTGARTALQRIDPNFGYKAPSAAHFHHMDEEIFVLKGRFTFDGEVWLTAHSYCFHPSETVHGFKSALAEESWFLSRVSQELDFNFVEKPRETTKPYSLKDAPGPRGVSVVPDPQKANWQDVQNKAGKVVMQRLVLSQHPQTGEGSMLVRFLPGWESPYGNHFHSVYEEAFVLDGALEAADGTVYGAGCYSFKPPRTVQSRLQSERGALCYINVGGLLDFVPAAKL